MAMLCQPVELSPAAELLFLAEPAEADAQLDGVDAGIRLGHAGVRNVLVADLGAQIVFALQKVQSECAAAGEINLRGARRSLEVGKKRAAANLEIGRDFAGPRENPLEGERIDATAAGSAIGLRDTKERKDVEGVFEAAFEKAGSMRRGQNQTEARANIENAVIHLAAVDGVAAACEDLPLVFTFLRAGLRACAGRKEQRRDECADHGKQGNCWSPFHKVRSVNITLRERAQIFVQNTIHSFCPRRTRTLFQVAARDWYDIVGGFPGRFGVVGHMVTDVIFSAISPWMAPAGGG